MPRTCQNVGRLRSGDQPTRTSGIGRPHAGTAGSGPGQSRYNSVTEVLQVMLLNNIKIKHQASQIVAMDWAKGVVVQLPNGNLEVVDLNRGRCGSKVSRVGTSTPVRGGTIM